MKKVMIVLTMALGFTGMTETPATAQVNVQINIGRQPGWGPTGYDYVTFYYLPELNCYYDVVKGQFIIPVNNRWIYSNTVPSRYRSIDLYHTYKVVVNKPNPYLYNSSHMRQYARYKNNHTQAVIRNSQEYKYYQSAGHPKHNQWTGNNGNNRTTNNNRTRNNRTSNSRTSTTTNSNRNSNTVRTNPGTTRGTQQSVRTTEQKTNQNNRGQR